MNFIFVFKHIFRDIQLYKYISGNIHLFYAPGTKTRVFSEQNFISMSAPSGLLFFPLDPVPFRRRQHVCSCHHSGTAHPDSFLLGSEGGGLCFSALFLCVLIHTCLHVSIIQSRPKLCTRTRTT